MADFNINNYDDLFVLCRTFGHSWSTPAIERENGAAWIRITCDHCGCSRLDEVSLLTGSLFSRKYEYAEGYRHEGKLTRDEYRMRLVRKKKSRAKKAA